MFLNLIIKYVSYSVEISHLAVECREGISLLVSDWLSQLSLRWAQSLLSDTAAHSHRQKYPANWMAYVRHSPQGTAPRVSVCVQQKDRTVGEWKRETAGIQTEKCLFSPLFVEKPCQLEGVGWGKEGINLRAEETWLMAFLDKPPQVKVQDIFPSEDYVGKCEYSAQTWCWKLWVASTCGKGGLKYVGQIGLCQLCLLNSSDGLIEPDMALHLRLPLWLGLCLSSHSCYSH